MATTLTLGILKPDAIASGKAGLIIAHIQKEGFVVRAARLVRLTAGPGGRSMRSTGRPFYTSWSRS